MNDELFLKAENIVPFPKDILLKTSWAFHSQIYVLDDGSPVSLDLLDHVHLQL